MKKYYVLLISILILEWAIVSSIARDNTCVESTDPTAGYCNYHVDRPENGPPVHRLSCDDVKNENGSVYMTIRCEIIPT